MVKNIFLKNKTNICIICTILQSIFLFLILFFGKDFILYIFTISSSYLTGIQNTIVNTIYYGLSFCIPILYFLCNYKNNENYNNFKNLLFGISSIAFYFIASIFKSPIMHALNINSNTPTIVVSIVSILYLLLIILIIVLINIKSLEANWKNMKKNYNKYFSKYLKYWIITTCAVLFINLILYLCFTNSISGNETLIRQTLKTYPIYCIFSSIIFAPIVEEIVFRKSIRNIISNKKIFIIVSGLFFGWLHVGGNITVWSDLLYIIPYSIHGGLFAYFLVKTDNIFVSMGFHFLHNGIMTSLQVLLLLLGAL